MPRIVRSFFVLVAATILGLALIMGVELITHSFYPFPRDLDPDRPEALAAFLRTLPPAAFLLLLIGWNLGLFGATWLAARLAPGAPRAHAALVAAFFLLATLANLIALPHPRWVVVGALVTLPLAAVLGTRLGRPFILKL